MSKNSSEEIKSVATELKKYRLAGVSFFVLNILYVLIALWKLPPVAPDIKKVVYIGLFILVSLILILSPLIFYGKRFLVQVLTVVYGGRVIYSVYSLLGEGTFPAVPYFFPCLVLTFYLLGRAAWNWP